MICQYCQNPISIHRKDDLQHSRFLGHLTFSELIWNVQKIVRALKRSHLPLEDS